MKRAFLAGFIALAAILTGCVAMRTPAPSSHAAEAAHQTLARTVAFPKLFQQPDDGSWLDIQRYDVFRGVRKAGFTAVRIFADFDHAPRQPGSKEPELNDTWLTRLERVARQADRSGLAVVLAARTEADLSTDAAQDRLVADWSQLAWRLRTASSRIYFELLENPAGDLTDAAWSRLAEELRLNIRLSNPTRTIIVGPAHRYDPAHLPFLDLPPDPNLLFAFAYNEPVAFTRQGDPAIRGSDAWLGTRWTGTGEEMTRIETDLDRAARWARQNGHKLVCFSFISSARAEPTSRMQWTYFVARALEERDIAWCYGSFASDAGVFDRDWRIWRQPLLDTLLNK
ncbi:MAG: cellulase family glycosylhydrolase [Kiritimatiellae bacterium]|nr:cellulase family glycosylhydrolase [Kiritimatiellia bacterium]MCO5067254.1 glycoside hydrolase family 5 protein [Kiritimatiellia bacterium]